MLDVYPSDMPGMTFQIRHEICGHQVFLLLLEFLGCSFHNNLIGEFRDARNRAYN